MTDPETPTTPDVPVHDGVENDDPLEPDGGVADRVGDDTDVTGFESLESLGGDEEAGDRDEKPADGEAALRARVQRLEAENKRLRRQYVGVRESRYGRTALGLAVVGLAFGLSGLVVTSAQEVLFTIGATGLFGAVLTRYLTPERFIPHDVGEGIFAAMSDNEASIATQLGLSTTQVYLATDRGPRLFVPEVEAFDATVLDDPALAEQPLVVSDDATRSGLALRPTGEPLLRAFETQHGGTLSAAPAEATATAAEAVTDVFELAARVETTVKTDGGRATFEVSKQLYGSPDRFDHPVASFLGSSLASALETPVSVDIEAATGDDQSGMLVACQWDAEAVETDDSLVETDEDQDQTADDQ